MPEYGDTAIFHQIEQSLQGAQDARYEAYVQPRIPELPVFLNFLGELKEAGIPVGTSEFVDLQRVLDAGIVRSVGDLYPIARATMVKDVKYYDAYDQVFARLFGEYLPEVRPDDIPSTLGRPAIDRNNAKNQEKVEQIKEQELSKEENESKEIASRPGMTEDRHGGTDVHKAIENSPVSAPEGKGESKQVYAENHRNRSLAERIIRREYQQYNGESTLTYAQFNRALSRLITLFKGESDVYTQTLDVDATVTRIARNGGLPEFVYQEEEERSPKVLVLIDVRGSTDAFRSMFEGLMQASKETLQEVEIYYFHNAIYGEVFLTPRTDWGNSDCIPIERLLHKDQDTKLIIVGDASMNYEGDTNGGLHDTAKFLREGLSGGFYEKSGYENFRALRDHFCKSVWLTPFSQQERNDLVYEEEEDGRNSTIKELERLFYTYDLSINGLEQAVLRLMEED